MHILIGAIVGAVFAVGTTVGMALIMGRKPVWKHVALAALGGAVGGAVASATLGAGGFAAASLGRQVVGMGMGGAMGGASERVAENIVEDRPLHEGVARSTIVGAGTGVVSLGMTRASGAAIARFAPRLAAAPVAATGPRGVFTRIMAAPTPGTGRGFLRGLEARREANEMITIDLPLGPPSSAAIEPDAVAVAPAPAPLDVAPITDQDGPERVRAPTPGLTGALSAIE